MDQLHSELKLTLSVGKINLSESGTPTAIEDVQFSIEGSSDVPQPLMQTVYGMMERAFNKISEDMDKPRQSIPEPPPFMVNI